MGRDYCPSFQRNRESGGFCTEAWRYVVLVVLNGLEERVQQYPLSFLGEGWYEGTVLNDNPSDASALAKQRVFCRNIDSLTAHMRVGGGYIAMFTPR